MRPIEFRYRDGKNMNYDYPDGDYDVIWKIHGGGFEGITQYTGLKDKNGKKIFEGDIIKTKDFYNKDIYSPVEYYKYGFFPFFDEGNKLGFFYGKTSEDVEVIGNIYQNKDLIDNQ